ncbi:MAG: N-(5'-phosphoribosyl)anthranilate isomerase [Pseudomonadota bacterium]
MTDRDWLDRLFSDEAVKSGALVCRSAADVERHIGRVALEREVRARRFRMVQIGDQIVIACAEIPIRVLV